MVQSKVLIIPEGYVLRKLAAFERVQDFPDALLTLFNEDIQSSIRFANYVVRHFDVALVQRMLLLLEKLPGDYLGFFLSDPDLEENTMGHILAMSDHYLDLEPIFLRCMDKLSLEAQERLSALQNGLGQTIEDVRAARDDATRVTKRTPVCLPGIEQIGYVPVIKTQDVLRLVSPKLTKRQQALLKEGFFKASPLSNLTRK
ncbi:MAG: hypothetical protein K0U37_03535 [Gammaproteobacteria bacterium]|nr:hypothetical protein [Gammaproteobacteria bacterium]